MRFFLGCSALLSVLAGCPRRPPTTPAPITCAAYAAHLQDLAEAEIRADGGPDVDRELLVMRTTFTRLSAGCLLDDRLSAFGEAVRCQMDAPDDVAFHACQEVPGYEGLQAYVTDLLEAG